MYDNEPTMMGGGQPTANLVVRQGTQAGMSFPISGNQVIIGREEGLDIILQDAEASRRHARISWQGGHYVIEDLGSTNGSFVNGVQITSPQMLNPGDSIGIGQTALVFQVAGAQPAASPYQTPDSSASYSDEAESDPDNKTLQYVLYGCGCLLLLCICSLLTVVAVALINPTIIEDIIGVPISSITLLLISLG